MGDILLPDSRPALTRGVVRILTPFGFLNHVKIFCASCGANGGYVPEENCTFAFYLCDNCAEKYGQIVGMYTVPDEQFFCKVREYQFEKFGRDMTAAERETELSQPDSSLSKLAKERPGRN